MYNPLVIVRRLLGRPGAERLRSRMKEVWEAYQENPGMRRGTPISRLDEIRKALGWTWEEPFEFRRPGGTRMSLTKQEDGWWLHELRAELRQMIYRTDADMAKRDDVKEAAKGNVAYEITTALLRAKEGKKKKKEEETGEKSRPTVEGKEKEEGGASNEEWKPSQPAPPQAPPAAREDEEEAWADIEEEPPGLPEGEEEAEQLPDEEDLEGNF